MSRANWLACAISSTVSPSNIAVGEGLLDHRVAEKLRLAGTEKWRRRAGRPRAELQKNLSSSIRNACQWTRANALNSELLKPEIDFFGRTGGGENKEESWHLRRTAQRLGAACMMGM